MGLFIWWCSGTTQLLLSVALVRPWLVTKPGTRNQIFAYLESAKKIGSKLVK